MYRLITFQKLVFRYTGTRSATDHTRKKVHVLAVGGTTVRVVQRVVHTSQSPHTSGPKPVRSNFIRVVQIRVRSSVGGWDAVLFSRCPSHRRTELRTCARVRCKYLSDSWKSTRSLKLQRKFAFGMLFAPFRQLHFKKINCTI